MREILKRLVNGTLGPLGLEIRRAEDRRFADPFWVQTEFIKEGRPVIFDVGAHVGQTTLLYRKLFPGSVIHAFEPFPESFEKLETQVRGIPSVTLNKVAVSDAEGSVSLNANSSSATNSLLPTDPRGAEAWGQNLLETSAVLQVPTTTIDSYCREHSIETVSILKLDIQGAELKALHGARSMLAAGRIGLVYMELILAPTYQNQPSFEDYLGYFHAMGYTMLDMFNPVRKDRQLIQSDIIWVRRK